MEVTSSGADIYFDDNNSSISYDRYMLKYFTYDSAFDKDPTPSNLPGGKEIPIPFNVDYSFDSDPKLVRNGINPEESLGILFNLNDSHP